MSSECFWNPEGLFSSECWSSPLYVILQIISFIALIFFMRYLWRRNRRLSANRWRRFEEVGKEREREHQGRVSVAGAESWSRDDVDLRIHQLERILNPKDLFSITSSVFDVRKREEIEDAVFKLKRISARKSSDDISPDTIIGYERE